jgi:hypothetical protein
MNEPKTPKSNDGTHLLHAQQKIPYFAEFLVSVRPGLAIAVCVRLVFWALKRLKETFR